MTKKRLLAWLLAGVMTFTSVMPGTLTFAEDVSAEQLLIEDDDESEPEIVEPEIVEPEMPDPTPDYVDEDDEGALIIDDDDPLADEPEYQDPEEEPDELPDIPEEVPSRPEKAPARLDPGAEELPDDGLIKEDSPRKSPAEEEEPEQAIIWINDDISGGYQTINEAVAAASAGDVIHVMVGDAEIFTGTNVNKAVTLEIVGNLSVNGDGSSSGITLGSGATLRCAEGGSLTMINFGVALNVASGATVTDGTYSFYQNTDATHGISIAGAVKGSTDRNSVHIVSCNGHVTNFYEGTAIFENCVLFVTALNSDWIDTRKLSLKNASFTVQAFDAGYGVSAPSIIDSEYTVRGNATTGNVWYNGGTIQNSTVSINTGSKAGLSLGGGEYTFTNSTLSLRTSGSGGLNINTGKVIMNNSTLTGRAAGGFLFGIQANSTDNLIVFQGESHVETSAQVFLDNGLQQLPNSYVVLGGSHRVRYDNEDFFNYPSPMIPVNGVDHGNEKLSYVKLADPSVTELHPIDLNGAAYTYPVATPSGDGNKYVWVPSATLTYNLNGEGATFADGTTADKSVLAIRGEVVTKAASVNDKIVTQVADPSRTDDTFEGWYTDAACTSGHEFDPANDPVTANMTVYAKWKSAETQTEPETEPPTEKTTEAPAIVTTLQGDLLFNNDTEHTKIYCTDHYRNTNLKARVNIKPIQQQMQAISALYPNADHSQIQVDVKAFEFTTVLTSQEGLYFKSNQPSTLGFGEGFEIKTYTLDEEQRNYTITFGLKDADQIKTFDQVEAIVNGAGDTDGWMGLTLALSTYSAPEGKALTVEGTLQGTFKADTSYNDSQRSFDFTWTAEQWPDGSDAIATDSTKIQASLYISKEVQESKELSADILIGEDTEHDAIHEVTDGDTLEYTAVLDISSMKEQFAAISTDFANVDHDKIAIQNGQIRMNVSFDFPEGLTVPENPDIKTTKLPAGISMGAVNVDKNSIYIGFKFTNDRSITTLTALEAALAGAGDTNGWMTMTIPGIKVEQSKADSDQLTVTESISGSFYGDVRSASAATDYNFSWSAVQTADGKDAATEATDKSISYTVKVKKAEPVKLTLPGDIRIGKNTEHTEVYQVVANGTKVTLEGDLDVRSIKNSMNAIELQFPGTDHDKILVDVANFLFTAEIVFPDKMTVPESPKVEGLQFGGFEIKSTTVSGQKITVTFGLKDEVTTYADLEKAVDAAGDTMTISIADCPVSEVGRQTVTATVTGQFQATAKTEEGTDKSYDFAWTAVQTDEGRDAAAEKTDNSLRFTIEGIAVEDNVARCDADILIGDDTEHDQVYGVYAGDSLDYTFMFNAQPWKEKILAIADAYPDMEHDQIPVSLKNLLFYILIDIPEELKLPDTLTEDDLIIEGLGSDLKGSIVGEQTLICGAQIDDPTQIKTFAQLEAALAEFGGTDGWIKVTIPGVQVAEDLEDGTRVTIKATMLTMAGGAADTDQIHRQILVAGSGIQTPEGKDVTAPSEEDDEVVSLTPTFTVETQELSPLNLTLPGDILIGTDTEHEKVYDVTPGESLDYTGALKVTTIKQQMAALEVAYPNTAADKIQVDVNEFHFDVRFVLPTGLTLPAEVKPEITNFGDGFKISKTEVSGGTVKLTMALTDPDSIKNYAQLKAVVNAAGDTDGWMQVIIPGVTVNEDLTDGTQKTVVGTVTGKFDAKAWTETTNKRFVFLWTAEQIAEGKDAVATDDKTIQFTAEIALTYKVMHSSNKETVTYRMSDDPDGNDDPAVLDITKLVYSGYVYGGIYTDETFKTPITDDGADGLCGLTIKPEAGRTYYLHEIVLSPVIYTSNSTATGLLKSLYMITAVDSNNYYRAGFDVTTTDAAGAKTSKTFYSLDQKLYQMFTVTFEETGDVKKYLPSQLFTGVPKAYTLLGVAKYNETAYEGLDANTSIEILPFVITRDGVKVTGEVVKNVNTGNGKAKKYAGGMTTSNSSVKTTCTRYTG